jgi:hypothetical protein
MAKLTDIEPLISDGRIFSVEFIKRTNDEDRFMVARTGVKKGVTGRGLSFNPRAYNLLSVYDITKRAFRFVSCERILWIKHHGQKIVFWPDAK